MIVVDSTIIVAWGVQAPWSHAAARLLEEGEPLMAPQMALGEAWRALRALCGQGHVREADFVRLSALLPGALAGIAPDQSLMPAAAKLVTEHDLTAEAALCLALASARKGRLATADPAFAREAMRVLRPDDVILLQAAAPEGDKPQQDRPEPPATPDTTEGRKAAGGHG
jgi:predicted nucleic acid-binding protein